MPTYEYRCKMCDAEFEITCRISRMKRSVACIECPGVASLRVSKGFTHGDEAPWLNNEIRGVLQDDSEARKRPISTRGEYKDYLKKNDIVERG